MRRTVFPPGMDVSFHMPVPPPFRRVPHAAHSTSPPVSTPRSGRSRFPTTELGSTPWRARQPRRLHLMPPASRSRPTPWLPQPPPPPPPPGAARPPPSVVVASAPPTWRSNPGGRSLPLKVRAGTTSHTCRCLSRAGNRPPGRHESCIASRSRLALPTLPFLLPGPGNFRRPHGAAIPRKIRPSVLKVCR